MKAASVSASAPATAFSIPLIVTAAMSGIAATVTLTSVNATLLSSVVVSVPFCTVTLPARFVFAPTFNAVKLSNANVAFHCALSGTSLTSRASILACAAFEIASATFVSSALSAAGKSATVMPVIAAFTLFNSSGVEAAATVISAVPGVPAVPVAVTVTFAIPSPVTVNEGGVAESSNAKPSVTGLPSASSASAFHVKVLSVASSGATVAVNVTAAPPTEMLVEDGVTVTPVTGTSPGSSPFAVTVTLIVFEIAVAG